MISATLDIFEEYGIKGSFFVTTGIDETYRNFKHYTPWKLISGNNLKRYGLCLFSGLLTKNEVQKSKEINMILEQGHELGLHGYSHYNWMNHLDTQSKEELSCWISTGCELFEKAFGFYPECFSVPGFKTNMNYLEILDDFGFRYSSDFKGVKPYYPTIKNVTVKTLQIPVSLAIGEYEDKEALRILKEQITKGYAVFYFHPSNEPIFRKDLIEKALSLVAGRAVPLRDLIS
jgi:undecaprenyl phosphate-alpha-L-ara4FN deformylase